jgi:DNA-binding transcriptional LysR family regulator
MRVFRSVVERASFAAAARDLRLSNGAVSKHVATLEESLGVRLLNRTTRRVTTTAAGAAYFERSRKVLEEIDEMERSVGRSASVPAGLLRVSVPLSFGLLHVTKELPALLAAHPELSLDVSYTDRFVDLLEERVDVVIRASRTLPDATSLVAQKLARAARVLCAAPSYLARRGAPRDVAQLPDHDCVMNNLGAGPRGQWTLSGPGGPETVEVRPRLVLSNSLAVRDAVLAGVGLSVFPAFFVDADLREGRLVRVLEPYAAEPVTVSAVYPGSRHPSPKLRVFVDHLRARFARAPWALKGRA